MESYAPFLAGLVALLVGLAAGKAWERYKLQEGRWIDRRRARESPHYILGLNSMVAGQLDRAIGELAEAARLQPDALEIELILGNLYREKGQVGRAVLPSFLTVSDDPTLRRHGDRDLNGAYRFDDQGVPAQPTLLVEAGVLKGYLLSRRPVRPFLRSNGHGRSQGVQQPVARMGTLLVRSAKAVPLPELKRLLLDEARRQGKPYALVIRDISGGNTNTASYGYQAFKGTPRLVTRIEVATGKEELVRGVELVGTPLAGINKLMATSEETRAFNGYCGAESGWVPVSTVAPWALVSEIELQRVARANERSPILPAPWSEPR